MDYYSHHELRLKNVMITNFTIIVIKRKLIIRSNSLIINAVRSCENPALVDEGGSANVEVLRLLKDGRLNKTLVSRNMMMNLIRVINIKRGRKIEGYGTANSHARATPPSPLCLPPQSRNPSGHILRDLASEGSRPVFPLTQVHKKTIDCLTSRTMFHKKTSTVQHYHRRCHCHHHYDRPHRHRHRHR